MAKRVRSLRCPICRKIVLKTEMDFPFCSERCRELDLGKWASGAYVVLSAAGDLDLDDEDVARVMEHLERKNNGDDDLIQ